MINILLPAMGSSEFFKDSFFPKLMYEIKGKTMIELVVENYLAIKDKKFTFVFNDEECMKFHIDSSVKLLTPDCNVIRLKGQTAGALCTCLMAVEYINNDDELIIANSDQIINVDYNEVIESYRKNQSDAGVIVFPDIHPRWSYAVKENNEVIEVAEKRPLSKNAIAGFYYFKHGKDFIEAAKNAILKRNFYNEKYYISASINELILLNKKVSCFEIEKDQYKSFYSPAKIEEYEVD